MTAVRSEYGVDKVVVGEDYLLHYSPDDRLDGTARLIICTHGHAGTAAQWAQNHTQFGRHAAALVRTGKYMVLAVSAGGPASWSNPASQSSIAAGITYAQSRGARTGKYGLMGYSMGGLVALNRIKRDAANIAGALLWSPVTDLAWANGANGSWSTEIATAFGTYAASAGYRVADEPTTFHGLSVPVKVIHSTDDATVPYSKTTDFLAAVNNPLMTLRQPDVLGGHIAEFQSTPDAETVAFFDSLAW